MEDDGLREMRLLQEASTVVAEFRGTDPLKHVDQMLTHLAGAYRAQLADVGPEELVRVQSLLRQTLAIRGVLRGTQSLPIV